jgi:hypothetical protein
MSELLLSPDHDCIAELAYTYWVERGRPDGSPEVDWHRAVATFTTGLESTVQDALISSVSMGHGTL